MSLLRLANISLSYGADPLLDHVDLAVEAGERLCLVGRNGSGKSTLLRVIGGELEADDGTVERQQGLTVARLVQEVPDGTAGSIFDVVASGLSELGELIGEHARLGARVAAGEDGALERMQRVQDRIEAAGGWELTQRVETTLSRLDLPAEADFAGLSGGMKRRVMLARALVRQPDVLLLDEPTNHLDIDAIRWLEDFLRDYPGTLVFITHDRALIRAIATRIVELDRGKLTSWPGSWNRYLEKRQEALDAEEKERARFDKKLSQEERWIRQGIKARRTRNEGRVRALERMRREFAQRRDRQGTAKLDIQRADTSGKVVIEAEHLHHEVDGRVLIPDFSLRVMRGDRIGVIGPNGCGKSTLLRLLLGEEKPQSGRITLGTKLNIAWFDQLRAQLDENATVVDNVAEGSDVLTINGRPKHVMGYLQEFLFEPGRARQPVSSLSGGERSRLLLAKLFTREFNLLVLDEPTNDLDVETLELLEEQLLNYQGTLLLVSHDREFLDNVVTSTLVFENGELNQYVGGYDDWLRQRPTDKPKNAEPKKPVTENKPAERKKRSSLTYAQRLELEKLPGRIEELEGRLEALQQEMADPGFYQRDAEAIAAATEKLRTLENELEDTFARWEELDSNA